MEHYEEQWSRPRLFCHSRPTYTGPGSYSNFDFWGEWLVMLWTGVPFHLNQPYVDNLRQVAPYAGVWLLLCFVLWLWKRGQPARVAVDIPAGAVAAATEMDALNARLREQLAQSVPGSAFNPAPVQSPLRGACRLT